MVRRRLTGLDLLLYILVLVQIAGFITTLSRAGSLGFACAVLFLIISQAQKLSPSSPPGFQKNPAFGHLLKENVLRRPLRIFAIFLVLVAITLSLVMMIEPQGFTYILGIRAAIWQGAQNMIKAKPLTGYGIGSFSRVYPSFRPADYFLFPEAATMTLHSHNEFLETWAELGIIGLLLNLGFIISLFIFILKSIDKVKDKFNLLFIQGIISGIIGLYFQNIFCLSLRIPFIAFYLWLGLGLITGLASEASPVLEFSLGNKYKRAALVSLISGLAILGLVKFTVFPLLSDFYFEKGYRQRAKGDFSGAVENYSRAISFSSSRPDLYYSRAFILSKNGKIKEALKDYLKVDEISPGYAKVHLNLGITYLSLGDIPRALEKLKLAIASNPYDDQAHNSLGVAYAKSNLPAQARREFTQALRLNPALKEANLNLIKLGNDYIP